MHRSRPVEASDQRGRDGDGARAVARSMFFRCDKGAAPAGRTEAPGSKKYGPAQSYEVINIPRREAFPKARDANLGRDNELGVRTMQPRRDEVPLNTPELMWARAFARWCLGIIFAMAGAYKVFVMGVVEHARRLFVLPYADSFLPQWLLWGSGTVIPFVELLAGLAMIVGWRVRESAVALGVVLVVVTFGHQLADPFYRLDTHVLPRLLLLVVVLALPREADRLSADALLATRDHAP